MSEVSCLMTGYKRPDILAKQYAAIKAQTIKPAKIAIWHNFGGMDVNQKLIDSIPNVQSSNTNWGVWPRFLFCMEFTTEYVCVFDDDTIPGTRWFENCLNCMKTHEGLYGTNGRIYVRGSRRKMLSVGWSSRNTKTTRVDIVGHAWFFKRDWLRYYALEPRQGGPTCGEDYHFSVALQKHLGLHTYVPPHPPNDKTLWGSTQRGLGADKVALYKQPGESTKKAVMHAAYIESGWRPIQYQPKPV